MPRASAQTAQFTASALSGCAPLVVTFDASGSSGPGPLSYQWSFGNGNSAAGPAQAAPGAAYLTPGTYTVTLTVSSPGGPPSAPVSRTITVFGNPSADFSASPLSGCPPHPVQFADLSVPAAATPIVSWLWDFGDGSSSSTQAPAHTFGSGSFPVTLIVTDANGCQGVAVRPGLIQVAPAVSAQIDAAQPRQTCASSLSVQFNPQVSPGPLQYLWDFGDGSTSAQAQPQHAYTGFGLYDVTLTVTDPLTGCSASDTAADYVRLIGQITSASASLSGACVPVTASFSNTSQLVDPAFQVLWNFGDGSSQSGPASALANVAHTYALSGTYQPVLTVDMGPELCVQSYALPPISAASGPSVQILRSDSAACAPPLTVQFSTPAGADTAWLWDFGDGSTSSLPNPVHTYTAYGSFPVSLTVWSAAGCADSAVLPDAVRIIDPVAAFTHNLPSYTVYPQYWDGRDPAPIRGGCLPLEITFTDQSVSPTPIVDYSWSFGDGNFLGGPEANPLHTYTQEGEFDVILQITTADGCVRTDTCLRCIRAGNPPVALLDTTGYPTLSCCDPSTLFVNQTDTAAHDYVWYAVTTGDWEGFQVNDTSSGNWNFGTIVPVFMDSGQYVSTMFYAYSYGCVDSFYLENWTMLQPPWGAAGIPLMPCVSNFPPGGTIVFDTTLVTYVPDTSYIDSVLWEFGDPLGSTSNELYPTFTYPDTGSYWITVTTWNFEIGCSCRVSGQQRLQIVVRPDTVFSAAPLSGCAPLASQFSGPANQTVFWDWDIGPGYASSSEQNPLFIFDSLGTYDVRLIVGSPDGCRDTVYRPDLIEVSGIFPRIAASDTAGCAPFTLTLTDLSVSTSPIVSRTWTLPDGTVVTGNQPSLAHTFAHALQHPDSQRYGLPVILTLSDSSGCTNQDTLRIYLFAPEPAWAADTLHQCAGDTLILSAGPSRGAGGISAAWWSSLEPDTLRDPEARLWFPAGQPVTLSLTVTDSLGCRASRLDTLLIQPRRPQAQFSAFPVQATCPPLLVRFTDLSQPGHAPITQWQWSFGDGSGSALADPSKVFASTGTYDVSLQVTDSLGCTDLFEIPDLIRLSGVTGGFEVQDDTICRGDSVLFVALSPNAGRYTWDFGDGNLGYGQTFLHHYDRPGELYPALVQEDSLGLCSVTLTDTLRVFPVPSVPLPIDTAFCEGGSAGYDFTQPGAVYQWSTGSTDPAITLTQSGQYGLRITYPESGCFSETEIRLLVWPPPQADLGIDRVLCEGDTILLQLQTADTLQQIAWSTGTVRPAGPGERYLAPRADGQVQVRFTDLRGCEGRDSVGIQVVPKPLIDLAYDPLCLGDTLLLDASPRNFSAPQAAYFWLKDGEAAGVTNPSIEITEPGLYEVWFTLQECRSEAAQAVEFNPLPESDRYRVLLNCVYKGEPVTLDAGSQWAYQWEHSGETSRTVQVVDSAVYYFRVFNEYNCFVRDSIEVVDACPPTLYVPNAITPNGDGINEAFGWAGDYIDEFEMQIFSRWGMRMYSTPDLHAVWDATYNGKPVPEGVYTWRVVYNGTHPDWKRFQERAGTVTVIR
ncbi:MAG: PKD domain-containing protein [Bacteroidia bacterium]|nr:PKD domain-containing protein [Bacteroidia bacterium]